MWSMLLAESLQTYSTRRHFEETLVKPSSRNEANSNCFLERHQSCRNLSTAAQHRPCLSLISRASLANLLYDENTDTKIFTVKVSITFSSSLSFHPFY